MKYTMNDQDLNGLIDYLSIETKQKGEEVVFRYCPKCGRNAPKDDEWKFAINRKSGAFGCLRSSCGYHGHFVELCRDFGYKLGFSNEQQYTRLKQPDRRIVPRESAIAYLKNRGIGREVAERYEITASSKNPNVMIFPFFNEFGKMEFVKYRNMKFRKGKDKSKEWCEEGCKPILFGMKQCVDFEYVVITEGQLDSLSVAQAGIKNAVSVPTGARGFTWLSNCWDWITRFQTVIVFGDLEKGHMTLLDDLFQRLPNRIKAVRSEDYMGEKDANDILTAFGEEAVRKCVENAVEPDIDYVIELADVQRKNDDDALKIRTGILEFDEIMKGGIRCGQVFLLTGKSGHGKSTFASQIIAEALDQGVRVFAYSGELDNDDFQECLDSQLAGDNNMTGKKNEFNKLDYVLDSETEQRIKNWYRGRAFIYDNNRITLKDRPRLPDIIRKVIVRRGVQLVLVDNLMTAMDFVKNQNDLHLAQSHFVDELKEIATQYHVAVILIAHPRKQPSGMKESLSNDDISGSADIGNRVDIIGTYSKAKPDAGYDADFQITKNRKFGKLRQGDDAIHLLYSAKSKRIKETRSLDKRYGWEREPILVQDIDVPF